MQNFVFNKSNREEKKDIRKTDRTMAAHPQGLLKYQRSTVVDNANPHRGL